MPYTNVAFNPHFWKTLVQKSKFSTEDIPDLTGKIAIVTGANSGLGYATTVALASHGAHVFLACRSEAKAREAIERARVEIRGGSSSGRASSFSSPATTTTTTPTKTSSAPNSPKMSASSAAAVAGSKYLKDKDGNALEPKLEFLQLDLNDMNSCSRAAKEFLEKGLPLHILINNGGIMTSPFALSADGIEQQFAVNHMGYVLSFLILCR
jgi:retinol dehydrogenase-14